MTYVSILVLMHPIMMYVLAVRASSSCGSNTTQHLLLLKIFDRLPVLYYRKDYHVRFGEYYESEVLETWQPENELPFNELIKLVFSTLY